MIKHVESPEEFYHDQALIKKRSANNLQVLAEPNEDLRYYPIACSSYGFSFHETEKKTLDDLRKWSNEYLRQMKIFNVETSVNFKYMKQAEYNLFKDFDLTVKMLSIDPIDD